VSGEAAPRLALFHIATLAGLRLLRCEDCVPSAAPSLQNDH